MITSLKNYLVKGIALPVSLATMLFTAAPAYASDVSCHVWDSDGDNQADIETCFFDHDGDGRADSIRDRVFDDKERVTMERWDYNKMDWRRDFVYDNKGNLVKKVTDLGADGNIEEIIEYGYDADGKMTSREHDLGGNGTIDWYELFVYDNEGNLVTEAYDFDGDSCIDMAFRHLNNGKVLFVPREI
ncbi:hypothetical protein ACFL96_19975 [Thermoproteota archaeon]